MLVSAAGFILAINIFVATLFAASFGVVAWRHRDASAARWLAFGYGLGAINAGMEFILPQLQEPRPLTVVMYGMSLGAFLVCVVGLARHYRVRVPWLVMTTLWLIALIANAVMIGEDATRSLARGMIEQLPYLATHLLAAFVVFSARRKHPLDVLLVVLLLVTGLQFLVRPFMGQMLGTPGPQTYLHSLYGAYSQMMLAFLLIADGLLMFLILIRDQMAALTTRSETDKLSGLLNRRGFEDRADRAILAAQRTGAPGSLVLADLDNFKTINDTLGHERGDEVIASFAHLLSRKSIAGMIIGRQGGEEFAVFLTNTDLVAARIYAELMRQSFADQAQDLGLERVSASFGVVQLRDGDDLSDLLRKADLALYDAKKNGRNQVVVANHLDVAPPSDAAERRNGSRRPA